MGNILYQVQHAKIAKPEPPLTLVPQDALIAAVAAIQLLEPVLIVSKGNRAVPQALRQNQLALIVRAVNLTTS